MNSVKQSFAPALKPWQSILLLAAAGFLAYANSFSVPFLYDDHPWIQNNFQIDRFFPSVAEMGSNRLLLHFTLALNHRLHGFHVAGYHVFNLAVHLAAASVLFLLIRSVIIRGSPEIPPKSAWLAAFSTSLFWMLHPLQTESVTYIVQRSESLMGLCYLATLYAAVRVHNIQNRGRWILAGLLTCALGMNAKQSMMTAPLLTLFFDRIFLARSWADILKRKLVFYLGLFATWGFLIPDFTDALGFSKNETTLLSGGFHQTFVTPAEYALNQPAVILHYLRLAVWPVGQCFDYDWPPAKYAASVLIPGILVAACIGGSLLALKRKPEIGFLGLSFFILLFPSSSFFPLAHLASEHRMYLPLAPLLLLLLITGNAVLNRSRVAQSPFSFRIKLAGIVMIASALFILTASRNRIYQSDFSVWEDVLNHYPKNERALVNYGKALLDSGRGAEALPFFKKALLLNPDNPKALNDLGNIYQQMNRYEEAETAYRSAITVYPDSYDIHYNLALLLKQTGARDEAIAELKRTLEINRRHANAMMALGNLMMDQGAFDQAESWLKKCLEVMPSKSEVHYNLANLYMRRGLLDKAVDHYQSYLKVHPESHEAHNNLAVALFHMGKTSEAKEHFKAVLRLNPGNTAALNNLRKLEATE